MQNGMMNPDEMPQDMEAMPQAMPEQGMMSQPEEGPLPSQEENDLPPYNGVIDVDGEQVEVVDGVFELDGEKVHVSDDGSIVMTADRDLLGRIENGVLVEADDAQIAYLKNLGMVE